MVEHVKNESCSVVLTAILFGITVLQVRLLSSRFGMLTAIHKRLSIVNVHRNITHPVCDTNSKSYIGYVVRIHRLG